MIKNYLKISLRYLGRNKEYSVINILGLAVGVCCCLLITMFVRSELSYDAFHSKSNNLYRVWQREKVGNNTNLNVLTPLPAGDALKSGIPEVSEACRIYAFNPVVKIDNSSFTDKVDMVDPSFFSMFDFHITNGEAALLTLKNSVVLTSSIARKYFGNADAIGKTMEIMLNDTSRLFKVTAVVADVPEASSIKFSALIPFSNTAYLFRPRAFHNWFDVFCETYLLLKPEVKYATAENKMPRILKQNLGSDFGKEDFTMHLQNIKDIHLNTSLPAGNEPISDPKYSYILGTIGLLILVVACINFITLSVSQSTKRALEVGVRKTLGAGKKQLILQFWGESLAVVLVAALIGLGLCAFLLPQFNVLVNKQLVIHFDTVFVISSILLVILIAVISGIYPALVLSAFKPVEVLKGKVKLAEQNGWLRKGLIVAQFTTSIVMIIGTIIIGQQMRYLETKDLGYSKDHIVVVETNKSRKQALPVAALFRSELLKYPNVINASISIYSLAQTPWFQLSFKDAATTQINTFQYNAVDANFISLMGIKILQGRNMLNDNTGDLARSALVNEAFVKAYNLGDAIGKKLPGPFPQQIVGVMKDFNFESLHTKIQPLVLSGDPDSLMNYAGDINLNAPPQPRISVLFKGGNVSKNIDILKQTWAKVAPGQDFDFKFLDDAVAAQYTQEHRSNLIVEISSGLSIFIACIGLFGLASLVVTKRVKEVGIRKVMGASVMGIVRLLSADFAVLVLLAAVIASPVAWWAMNKWLNDFTYHVPINLSVFVLAGAIAMIIALATVSYHSIRTALANPVKSLRSE